MSLKDRLNSQPKSITVQNISVKPEEIEKVKKEESENVEGFGILEAFFADKNLNSIYVSGAKNIFVERRGVVRKSTASFKDNAQLIDFIRKNAFECSEIDNDSTFIKFNYRKGINVSATLPPLSDLPVLYIKNYCDNNANIKSLQENKTISKEIAMIFEALATTKINILVAGNPNSLKTTVLSALTKLIQPNCNGILIDFENEFKIKADNFVNYDFLNIKHKPIKGDILNSIFNINPDRIVINNPDENSVQNIINYALLGSKGILTTINANTEDDVLDTIAKIIVKHNSAVDFETAKLKALEAFDLIILCNKDVSGLRTISKISELNTKENAIKDIFYLNTNGEHSSTGYVPIFYNSLKANFLSINSNVFDESYRHTYSQMAVSSSSSGNLIKKQDNSEEEAIEQTDDIDISEIQKRVQEKFEELRKNAKSSEVKEIPENILEEEIKQEENNEVLQNTEQDTQELSEEFLKQSAEEFIRKLVEEDSEDSNEEVKEPNVEPFEKQFTEQNTEQNTEQIAKQSVEQDLESIFKEDDEDIKKTGKLDLESILKEVNNQKSIRRNVVKPKECSTEPNSEEALKQSAEEFIRKLIEEDIKENKQNAEQGEHSQSEQHSGQSTQQNEFNMND